MNRTTRLAAMLTLAGFAALTVAAPLPQVRPTNSPGAKAAARPLAVEYNTIRRRAKILMGRLHSANAADAARAQNDWQSVIRDLEIWANKYHVRLTARTVVSKGPGTGNPPTHLPPADCKDISNLGPDGSAAGDNSAGHCYLQKRTSQVDKYLCTYFCVPSDVIQQPDIDDSPYPSGSSQP